MVVETYNEFSFILGYYLPEAFTLYKEGKLKETKSRIGTKEFFYFSPDHKEYNRQINNIEFNLSNFYSNNCTLVENKSFPDLNTYYKNDKYKFDKPIVTIQNKNNIEWGVDLFNFYSNTDLSEIINILGSKYQIVYIRMPEKGAFNTSPDSVGYVDLKDKEYLKENHPEVTILDDLVEDNWNIEQMKAMANADKHLTVAGGDAVLAAYFKGDLVIYNSLGTTATNRGIWGTNSYLSKFSGSSINGFNEKSQILDYIKNKWL